MSSTISPLAPKAYPDMPEIDGVRFATAEAGIRYRGRADVMLAVLDKGTNAAGIFTRSKCPSAPVDWCRAKLAGGKARALVVNSGNANAFTGKSGREAVKLTAALASKAVRAPVAEVFLASTGVIGEPLDATKFGGILDKLLGLVELAQSGIDRGDGVFRVMEMAETFPHANGLGNIRFGALPVAALGA